MEANTDKLRIKNLSEKRYKLFDEYNESYDEELCDHTAEYPKEIDELAEEIFDGLKAWRYNLPYEFIIEELTKLGQAPCILYDDEGHFAITGEGFQNVVAGEATDVTIVHFVKKDLWKDTMREALDYHLDVYLEDDE
jgi:hypothetical protein